MKEFYCPSCMKYKCINKKSKWNGVIKCLDCIDGILKNLTKDHKHDGGNKRQNSLDNRL